MNLYAIRRYRPDQPPERLAAAVSAKTAQEALARTAPDCASWKFRTDEDGSGWLVNPDNPEEFVLAYRLPIPGK
jgi:hypothetical protein